ncbi:MAG: hypothetical protein R2844_19310 [Caldilineales bacterium]
MIPIFAPPLQTETLADLPAWAWVAGSIAIYAVAGLVLWVGQRRGNVRSRLAGFLGSPGGTLLGWLARLVWLIAPGYAALLLGVVSPRLMGLSQIEIGAGLGQGVILALAALGLLALAVVGYRRGQPAEPAYSSRADRVAVSARLALEAGALQWQWSFFRAVLIAGTVQQGLGRGDPVYLGAWLTVALVTLEGMLNPLLWRDLRTPGLAGPRLLRAVILVVTTQIYLFSGNFWLGWAFHAAAVVLLEPRLRAAAKPGVAPHS